MDWLEVVKMLLPAFAAWVSVTNGLTRALERANTASASATAAHARIDSLIQQRNHHGN